MIGSTLVSGSPASGSAGSAGSASAALVSAGSAPAGSDSGNDWNGVDAAVNNKTSFPSMLVAAVKNTAVSSYGDDLIPVNLTGLL